MGDVVKQVHRELYCDEASIARNLIILVQGLKGTSEDIRVLSLKYVLELLESKEKENTVRKVLVS